MKSGPMTEKVDPSREDIEFVGHVLSRLPELKHSGAISYYTAGPDHIYIRFSSAKKESIFKRIFNKATMPINK